MLTCSEFYVDLLEICQPVRFLYRPVRNKILTLIKNEKCELVSINFERI